MDGQRGGLQPEGGHLPMSPPGVMHLQNLAGILLWPREEIAMVRQERTGRLEATSMRGEVAHRPGPLADLEGAPWVRVGDILVHPRHVRVKRGWMVVPGGWRLPVHGPPLPRPRAAVAESIIPELGVRPGEVLYLKLRGRGADYWMTDRGRIPAHGPPEPLAALHPGLLRVQGALVNRWRIRAFEHAAVPRLVLDDGTRVQVTSDWRAQILEALGIPDLRYVERLVPEQQGLYLLGLRDWPRPLATADAAELQEMFGGDERKLLANLAWETREHRHLGLPVTDGTTHRGYWYHPVRPLLLRAGVNLGGDEDGGPLGAVIIPPGGHEAERYAPRSRRPRPGIDHYLYFLETLKQMVGTYRLLTYAELGFDDPRPDLRVVGAQRPDVVLVVEKETVDTFAWELARRFGCSMIITRGQPTYLAMEHFARALRERHGGPVRVVAYVDFDPSGWIIAHASCDQLARYGVEVTRVDYLVRPSRFTARELRDWSYPVASRRDSTRTGIEAWVAASGGIRGSARGIHADMLRPLERLVAAFREETGLDEAD